MYGLTLHAGKEGKIKFNSVRQEMKHACRDLDPKKDVINRANENIVKERTKFNRTYAMNSKGNWYQPKDLNTLETNIESRFAKVKGQQNKDGSYRKVRGDAVCMREVIMQIGNQDNDYYAKYADHPEKIADDPTFKDMMEYTVNKFGKKNIAYFSVHVDEGKDGYYHPHVHLGVMTQYQDEKTGVWHFNQKKALPIIKNKTTLREAHKDFYSYMKSKGYDVGVPADFVSQRQKKDLTTKQYNHLKNLEAKAKSLDDYEMTLNKRAKALDDKEKAVEKDQQDADHRWDQAHERYNKFVKATVQANQLAREFAEAKDKYDNERKQFAKWQKSIKENIKQIILEFVKPYLSKDIGKYFYQDLQQNPCWNKIVTDLSQHKIDRDHDGIDDRKQEHHVILPDLSNEMKRLNSLNDEQKRNEDTFH